MEPDQAAFFAVVFVVSTSMTVQLFASADNLTMLARVIDLWTLCWSALYKWTAMVAYDSRFRQFHARLAAVHDRAGAAAGDGPRADRYTAARLRYISAVSYAYVLSGFLVVVTMSLGPLISYSKGYVRTPEPSVKISLDGQGEGGIAHKDVFREKRPRRGVLK